MGNPRARIAALIEKADLTGLLERAAQLHGHYCPGLASGVKAAYGGVSRLRLADSDGMERVMAEVECNNCFVAGVQVVTGCTFGNNALIYRDLGKTAVTLYRRGAGGGPAHSGEEHRARSQAFRCRAERRAASVREGGQAAAGTR